MNDLPYATEINIKRFQNLLETSVDDDERKKIQMLLAEEKTNDVARDGTNNELAGAEVVTERSGNDADVHFERSDVLYLHDDLCHSHLFKCAGRIWT